MPTKRYEIVSPNIETSFYYLITYHSLLQLSTVSISMSILLRHEMKHWSKFLNIIRCIIMRPVFCICCMQSNYEIQKHITHFNIHNKTNLCLQASPLARDHLLYSPYMQTAVLVRNLSLLYKWLYQHDVLCVC